MIRRMSYNARVLPLAVVIGTLLAVMSLPNDASAQTTRERGIGPYTLVTKRGDATVRLLRRDNNIVWVDRQVRSGEYIETGVPVSEIVEFKSPRPPLFDAAEQAESGEQIAQMIDQLRRYSAQLRPYRDLPGIPMNEALLLQARLNEKREYWRDALLIYEEVLKQPYDFPGKNILGYRAGLDLWRMDQKEKALEYLTKDPIPDDDFDLLADILNARADCLSATGRPREAIDAYLNMIVFYPYVQTNELRALSGIIPNYVAIQDWDAAMKSIDALKRDYADAPETAAAEAAMAAYADQLAKERQFQVIQE